MTTPRIDEFAAFIKERHDIYLKRKAGQPGPWTADPILAGGRFCNVFRELDTVTIWIEENIRKPKNEVVSESVDQVVTLLSEMSKLFGKENSFISDKAKLILAIPKADTPCLGMRSRFKLEDCVHKV